MRKKMIAFWALCTAVVSLSAVEIPLTAKDFILGERTAGKVKYNVTFQKGVLTVIIPPTPNIGNATYGAILNIPSEKLVGMGVRFRGEVRYENVTSDAGGPFWGRKKDGSLFLWNVISRKISRVPMLFSEFSRDGGNWNSAIWFMKHFLSLPSPK